VLTPGEYSDTLRALGRFLDDINAHAIRIVEGPESIEVSWDDGRGARATQHYDRSAIEALRAAARMHRGLAEGMFRYGSAELLRTVGRDLDQMRASGVTIEETGAGFDAVVMVGETIVREMYGYSDLVARVQEYHRQHFFELRGS